MRIAYLSPSLIPSRMAHSVNIVKMCDAFARNGHDVTLLMPHKETDEVSEQPLHRFYGLERTFSARRLPWPNVRGRRFIYAAAAAWSARRMKADLVVGRSKGACYACALAGLPVVYDAHTVGEGASRLTHWVFGRLLAHPRLARLVTTTDALKQEYVRRYGVCAETITVASNGADDAPASGAMPLGENAGDRLQVGYVGHLYPGKGMEVIEPLARQCPWADFHVVGGTEDEVRRWMRRLGDAGNVRFHGFVTQQKAARFRAAFDVLLAPYQRSVSTAGSDNPAAWMSPLKVFEYLAAGKPILCSNLPVLREVLAHGKNARLLPPDAPARWVDTLAELRDHPEERERLGRQARRDFEQRHTWTARARAFVESTRAESTRAR